MSAAQDLARRSAAAMWANDNVTRALDMALVDIGPGLAALTMTVRSDMVNGHGICHGGMIFTLADTAFAYACNAYDQAAVAQQCAISFLAPGRQGDLLTARAEERQRSGRSGIYDIRVTNQDGTVIAEFRGHSRNIPGSVIPPDRLPETPLPEAPLQETPTHG